MIAVRFELTKLAQQNLSLPPLTTRTHNPYNFFREAYKKLFKTPSHVNMRFLLHFLEKVDKSEAGVEPAISRLEVGRDIHFATRTLTHPVLIYSKYYFFINCLDNESNNFVQTLSKLLATIVSYPIKKCLGFVTYIYM